MNININSIHSINRKNSFNNVKKSKKKGNKLLGYLTILVILIGVPIACIVYVYSLKQDKSISDWKPNVTDDEKIKRTSNRGSIISIILMLSSLVQATLKGLGASSTMLLLLYGFFMASVLGFMGDQGYGTDEGFSLKEIGKAVEGKTIDGLGAQLKYIFGTLNTNSFWRFIITVFLDMFISSPIQSIIVAVFNPHIELLKNTIPTLPKIMGSLLNIVIKNFDNVLQSFVAFITFLAYANETRFKWAYPGSDVNPNLLISTSVIKLSTAIAGVVYLIANISADFNIIDGATMKVGTSLVDRLDRKMWFVLIMIGLLTLGSLNESSFLNKKNNRYDIKPLVNMTDDSIWRLDDELLNNFYNDEILKLAIVDIKENINTELLQLDNEYNYIKENIEGIIDSLSEYYLDKNEEEFTEEKIQNLIQIFIRDNSITMTSAQLESLSNYLFTKLEHIFNTCRNKTGYWNICDVDPYTGNLILDTDTNTDLKTLKHYKQTVDNSFILVESIIKEADGTISPERLQLKDDIYQKAENNVEPGDNIMLSKYISIKKGWDNNPPCFIPDKDYTDSCSGYKEQFSDNPTPQVNENNGKLVKKIDMGLYRTHGSNIEDKYDIIDKSNEGFGIFCFYILIGVVLPFVPIKFIYGDELKEKGRLWKLILVFIVVYGIAGILYFISTKSPKTEELKSKEKEILNQ